MAITAPTYDPIPTATGLATTSVAKSRALLNSQSATNKATNAALTTLGSALSAFQSSLSSLTSGTKTISATSATFSNTAVATATANSKAAAGTYAFYVEQLATAGQTSYDIPDASVPNTGVMNITLQDNSTFQVSLANADTDGNGLSAKEIAAAINASASNNSQVTASTVTVNGATKLVLTSTKTGFNAGVKEMAFQDDDLNIAPDVKTQTVLTAAADAKVWLGGKTGTLIQQATNTFNVIDDVSFTINQAQAPSDNPLTLKVAPDNSATAANVQSFVTAYNTLLGVFKSVASVGDPATGVAAGALSSDSAIQALRNKIDSTLRAATGNNSLVSFGVTGNRDGTLSLDTARLTRSVAANPEAIDKLFGRASSIGSNESGVLGALNKVVDAWTNSTNGTLNARKDASTRQAASITARLATLDIQYDSAYKRYLTQFTTLQQLQSSMNNTSALFTAMFSSNSSSN